MFGSLLKRGRWWKLLLLLYAVALGASHLWRSFNSPMGMELVEQMLAEVSVVGGKGDDTAPVNIAYRDIGSRSPETPVLVFAHGTPVASLSANSLIDRLAGDVRMIIPDLPGFGGSTRIVPDYSVRAHAEYLLRLLDRLGIEKAHFFGYSRGGAVITDVADLAPERVESLILASAISVQEFELFGNYTLNRAVFALQLGAIWLAQEAIPHFGYLDHILLDASYARNFYDSDLRPHREILSNYEGPMLVIHGTADRLVPYPNGYEHYRIVPQSELVELGGDHLQIFREPELFARPTRNFIARVESGDKLGRASADPERIAASKAPFDPTVVPPAQAVTLLVAVLLIALASWVTVDGACVGAGLLVAMHRIELLPAIVACFGGILSGDILLYLSGRWFGTNLLHRAPFRWFVSEEAVDVTASWFKKTGPLLIIAAHFTPGTRFPTNFGSGVLKMPFLRLTLYFFIASLMWAGVLVTATAFLGGKIIHYFELYERYALPGMLLAGFLLYLFVKIGLPMTSWHGRRLLLSRWRKLTRYEFWPLWRFYIPVVAYILYLGLKHRCLTLFTVANPSFPAGGVFGEEKATTLERLKKAGARLPQWQLLSGDELLAEKLESFDSFVKLNGLQYPVVLKPDEGQRGLGVAVVRSRFEAVQYLETASGSVLVQEYIPGLEYGVFYYRYPGEDSGATLSITDKRFPEIVGNGKTTLEHLILANDRAVSMAPLFLDRFRERLFDVPAEGERIPLVEIGTHSLGSLFLDGTHLAGPGLVKTLDEISHGYEGFYFGRFDVRAPSPEALTEGRDLTFIEVNGVTSEATSIYDPGHTLGFAYSTLFEQWRIAFRIAKLNCERGCEPMPLDELVRYYRNISSRQKRIAAKRPPLAAATATLDQSVAAG